MSKKPIASLGGLVTVDAPPSVDVGHTLAPRSTVAAPRVVKPPAAKLKKAGFLVHPRALQQFDLSQGGTRG